MQSSERAMLTEQVSACIHAHVQHITFSHFCAFNSSPPLFHSAFFFVPLFCLKGTKEEP